MKSSCPPMAVLALLLCAPPASAANDAGASTFDSAERLYRAKVVREDQIRVPPVAVDTPPNLPQVPDAGPGDSALAFELKEFQVVGNTLLSPERVDRTLSPFLGSGKKIGDVQLARDALQKAYDEEGFLTVAVTIPQQTIDEGLVRLDVLEARIGAVSIENDGVAWFGDGGVRAATPHLAPGAILLRPDLEQDVKEANRNPDRRVRPVLKGGSTPGTVDVNLIVDDRIPLHGSVTLNNNHTPGSPDYRAITELSYSNLWGLGHQVTAAYQFAAFKDFRDVQIVAGTYNAPMPWSARQSLFYYIVYSKSANGIITAPDLSVLGNGLNMGLRYAIDLPELPRFEGFTHNLALGVDRKDVKNTVSSGTDAIDTPITYLPWSFDYTGTRIGEHTLGSLRLGFSFNRTGVVNGDSKDDFQANRGGVSPDNPVTGDYEVGSFSFLGAIRMPSLLQTLAAGRFVALEKPVIGFADDWTFNVRSRGQWASEPLISTEQFAAGGVDSVRGYLESEIFGDDGWSSQFELRAPTLRNFLGGYASETAQFLLFFDVAKLWTLNAGEGQDSSTSLKGYGFGVRASLVERITAEAFMGLPGTNTDATRNARFYFQVSAGF